MLGDKAAHKKTTKNHVLYSFFEGKYLLSAQKNYQTQPHHTFNVK